MEKTFAGYRLRRLREDRGLSQADLARRLSISASYLNQIEHESRPLTVSVLLRITEEFGVDAGFFATRDMTRLIAEVREALSDERLGRTVSASEATELAQKLPNAAEAVVAMYQRYQQAAELLAVAADERQSGPGAGGIWSEERSDEAGWRRLPGATSERSERSRHGPAALPHEEARDYFYRRHNYIAELDEAAERLAGEIGIRPGEIRPALEARLAEHGIRIVEADGSTADGRTVELHRYDRDTRRLYLASHLRPGQRAFRMAAHLIFAEQADLIDTLTSEGDLATEAGLALTRTGLASYFAAALIMPYRTFHSLAERYRYDIERLADTVGVGYETICHRLSTLQRPGLRGVPFSFIRVDRAGNMSKRQSASGFHFAHTGGTCPLWNVFEAFAVPGKILTQIAQMPDGQRYFWIARTVTRTPGRYGAPGKTFAIALGCELRHAHRVVYSTGLDVSDREAAVPIGVGCKVCERPACPQRAFPQIGRALNVDEHHSLFAPYPVREEPGA